MFRTVYLTFLGQPRDLDKFQHAHESPFTMTFPLMVLAFLSVFLGGFFVYHHNISKWLEWGVGGVHSNKLLVMGSSLGAFLFGWIGVHIIYNSKAPKYEYLGSKFSMAHQVLFKRYKFDELYLWFINRFYHPLARWLSNWDYEVLDQKLVDGVGIAGKNFSWLSRLFDDGIVDKYFIDGNGVILNRLGSYLRRLQSGLAQSYLFWMAMGLGSMFLWVATR